jgi:hypothetical protein
MPVLLLVLFSVALSIGTGAVVVLMRRYRRRSRTVVAPAPPATACGFGGSCFCRRPECWLAVRGRKFLAVQTALSLHNPKPCTWTDALAGEEKLFISRPVKGWILVLGSGLPDPGEDVDACFRFLLQLSRKLGQVQFFWTNRILHHHAWVKAEAGRIVRAYAWAGVTLWHQGPQSAAEKDLGLTCFDYDETPERTPFGQTDPATSNTEKVPLLAARWSLDPGRMDESCEKAGLGIAGESSVRY